MADDAMFAPLAAEKGAAGATGAAARPKSTPIVPVPADAPPCTWRHPKHGAPVAMWPYYDVDGRLLGYTARVEHNAADGRREKDVLPITYCRIGHANGDRHAWCARALPAPRPLYRLPELLTLGGSTVIITEGEKKADLVPGLFPGYCGTTSMGGANAAKLSNWAPLAGRNTIVWPDHDEPGTRYADDVAALAAAAGAASVAIVALPADWPEGWDLADPLPEGAVAEVLDELLQSAVPWTPPGQNQPTGEVDDAAEIARLAALPLVTYGRERKPAAERLGCPVSILDRAVTAARCNSGHVAGQGRTLDLHEPEPWPEPVDGAALLDELAGAVRRHIVLGEAEAAAVALWVLATHAFDTFSIFPRLFLTAPEKGCGKSTLLDALSRLAPKPLGASSITAAALFRVIEAARPTLLLDEADSYARDNEDLRGVLDAGHRRDGAVIRTVGEDHEPRLFSVWAPVALAAIGHLPGTVEDRSIKIGLRRRRPDEPVEPLRLDRPGALEQLASMAARWATDNTARLETADPIMPAGIANRTADNWRPLLAVAGLAGGTWPDRARRVAAKLSSDGEDSMSAGVLLLGDLRELFFSKPTGVLFTREILAALHADETRPWVEWKNGRPITERQLAALLKPHKIKPKTVRRGNETEKGYRLEWFEGVFASYLPPGSVTASQMRDSAGFETVRSVTLIIDATPDVTDRRNEKASVCAGCDGVTFPEPPTEDKGPAGVDTNPNDEPATWTG